MNAPTQTETPTARASPLRTSLSIIVAVGAALVGVLWVLSYYTEIVRSLVSLEAESRWGMALMQATSADRPPELRAEEQRLAALAQRLMRNWPDNPYGPVRVAVIEGDTGAAYALPGGVILVTTKLLDIVASENALAYALAHEIGHLERGDHLRIMGRGLLVTVLLDKLGWPEGKIGEFLLGSGLLTQRPFAVAQEEAADRFALALLHAEYGHVGGVAPLLEDISTQGWPIDHLVASPRRAGMRIGSLRNLAREEDWASEGETVPWRAD